MWRSFVEIGARGPTPRFFVSVDSKAFSDCVSLLVATLGGQLISVDFNGVKR
jgi:hypothetical protein